MSLAVGRNKRSSKALVSTWERAQCLGMETLALQCPLCLVIRKA